MPVPTYQEIMRPFLEYLAKAEGGVKFYDLCEGLAERFPEMTREEFEENRNTTGQRQFLNRAGWVAMDLKRAMLTHSPRYGYHEITQRGKEAIADKNVKIDRKYLMQYPEFYKYSKGNKKPQKTEQPEQEIRDNEENIDEEINIQDDWKTPNDEIDSAVEEINNDLEEKLLERTREIEPARFERIVVELLIAMGYGASGEALGRSGDRGVDGVINQDTLGVDKIYIQAKRYGETNSVPSREVRDFSGALDMKGVHKGIFVTTSSFSSEAEESVRQMQKNIILIDGVQLAKLMIRHNIGCTEKNLIMKEMREDFFE